MKLNTTTNYLKKISFSIVMLSSALIFAQEEEDKKLEISGSVDAYFRTNLTADDKAVAGEPVAPLTSFANETGFALGMANIIASYEGEKTGAVADLVFGPRGEQAITGLNVNQLYAYWNVSEGTTLTMGRFNTYLGYEVISPVGNFNYSTSHLFSSGPFSHTGIKADFTLSDDFSLMVAVMNVTDVDNNLTSQYALGAQLGYAGQYLNLYYDDAANLGFEIDYTGGFDLSDSFYLGINGAYADNDGNGFAGVALYPQVKASETATFGLRGEYFTELVDGLDDEASVFATTLTGSFTVEDLTIKPEVRLDAWSNDEPFLDNDGDPSKSLSTFLIAAIYSF